MIKCNNECVNEKVKFNGCCFVCPNLKQCEDDCEKDPMTCGDSTVEQSENDTQALEVFQSAHVVILNSIAELVRAKKDLEAKEAELKARLQEGMEKFGVKKFQSDILNITYVAATTANSIDSDKLKKKYPKIAEECTKTSDRKAYVKIELKGDKK